MLGRMTSKELAEWEAFEIVNGPLGTSYSDDMLAAVHEQLQGLMRLTGAQFEENPAPPVKHVKRPYELSLPEEAEEVMDESEVDPALLE